MPKTFLAFLLLFLACGRESKVLQAEDGKVWSDYESLEISSRRTPSRIVVTKAGWRSAPDTYIVTDPKRVQRVYKLLAGNERLMFSCGYHWNVQFDYRGAPSESIDINEGCEQFRRNHDAAWKELQSLFADARKHPTHYAIVVYAKNVTEIPALIAQLDPEYGTMIGTYQSSVRIAAKKPWTAARIENLRAASPFIAKVEPIEVVNLQ